MNGSLPAGNVMSEAVHEARTVYSPAGALAGTVMSPAHEPSSATGNSRDRWWYSWPGSFDTLAKYTLAYSHGVP
jgi:hypothetical protein